MMMYNRAACIPFFSFSQFNYHQHCVKSKNIYAGHFSSERFGLRGGRQDTVHYKYKILFIIYMITITFIQ